MNNQIRNQIQLICDKFDLDFDYFTGMVQRPKTFYLTQGEVKRSSFLAEFEKLSQLMEVQAKLRINPTLQIPSSSAEKLKDLFDVRLMTEAQLDKFKQKILDKILDRDF